ncbi:MAG: hypothetical protein ABI644_07805 [Arenimonas sp.]
MKKTLGSMGIALVTFLTIAMSGCSYKDFSEARFQAQLVQAASETNKTLPMMIDKETRLDSTIAGPGKQWTYFYTLVNYEAGDTTNEQINEILGDKIRNSFCSMKEMKLFIEHEVTMKYKYSAKDGVYLGEVVVTAMDCKKLHRSVKKPD